MPSKDDILKLFPFDKARSNQLEIIDKIIDQFSNDKKYVIAEMPTGAGKSAIGYTVGSYFSDYYYITAQKILQSQLSNDFGEDGKHIIDGREMVELKGRNAYECIFYKKVTNQGGFECTDSNLEEYRKKSKTYVDCSVGECKKHSLSKFKYCEHDCPYYVQFNTAIRSDAVLMNFHSFIFQTEFVKRWPHKTLLIIDECFHPHTFIQTDIGRISIGNIVNKNMKCNVLSYNTKKNKLEFKPITRWLKKKKQQTYKVLSGNRVLYPTIDHKMYTPNGMKKLQELTVGDDVLINEPSVTDIQQQLLLGSLMGDASAQLVESKRISNKYINKGMRSRVRFKHGPKQSDYLDWKYTIIQEHVKTAPKNYCNGGFTSTIRSFSTNCNIYDTIKSIFVNNKKSPNTEWLNQIDDFGLAVWFMDDGSISSDVMHFHTEGFNKHENDIICHWLINRYNVPARVLSYKKRNKILYYISVGRDGGKIIAKIISKYIPPFMRYKLPSGEWENYNSNIENIRSSPVSISKIKSIEPYKISTTYDIEVADNHNYFAGSTLVSNCHNAEHILMDYISFTFNDFSYNFEIPKLNTAEEYYMFFEDIDMNEIIRGKILLAVSEGDSSKEEYWIEQLQKYAKFKSSIESHEWVPNWEEKEVSKGGKKFRTIELKPLYVSDFAYDILFKKADYVLMMSATILNVNIMCKSLGIPKSQVYSTRLGSDFPVENRPIYFKPSGSMSFRTKNATMPRMLKDIEKICNEHNNQRGIIHTHNFEIAKYIQSNCSKNIKSRLFLQTDYMTKDDMLSRHSQSDNGIIVAPAMHEGLDLKNDLARFQIICKVPYPGIGNNPQLKIRMELDSEYYQYLTALKLVQSYGRSIRSKDDWAITYILDENFRSFHYRSKSMLPSWFNDAIIWDD